MHDKMIVVLFFCFVCLFSFIILCAGGVIFIKPSVDTTDTKLAESSHVVKVDMPPSYNSIMFGDAGKTIGKITWEDGKMKFEGDADKSAKIFFDEFLKPYADAYIKYELEKGEK